MRRAGPLSPWRAGCPCLPPGGDLRPHAQDLALQCLREKGGPPTASPPLPSPPRHIPGESHRRPEQGQVPDIPVAGACLLWRMKTPGGFSLFLPGVKTTEPSKLCASGEAFSSPGRCVWSTGSLLSVRLTGGHLISRGGEGGLLAPASGSLFWGPTWCHRDPVRPLSQGWGHESSLGSLRAPLPVPGPPRGPAWHPPASATSHPSLGRAHLTILDPGPGHP